MTLKTDKIPVEEFKIPGLKTYVITRIVGRVKGSPDKHHYSLNYDGDVLCEGFPNLEVARDAALTTIRNELVVVRDDAHRAFTSAQAKLEELDEVLALGMYRTKLPIRSV